MAQSSILYLTYLGNLMSIVNDDHWSASSLSKEFFAFIQLITPHQMTPPLEPVTHTVEIFLLLKKTGWQAPVVCRRNLARKNISKLITVMIDYT